MSGTVYTETVIYMAPASYSGEVPYQLAIVELEDGSRRTVRIAGDRVKIGDTVEFVEAQGDVAVFRKSDPNPGLQ